MATTFTETAPTTTQGAYGTIQDFGGGGMVFSDPRDNPNYKPVVGLSSANGASLAGTLATDIAEKTNEVSTIKDKRTGVKSTRQVDDTPQDVVDAADSELSPEDRDVRRRERNLVQAAQEADDMIDDMILSNKSETQAYIGQLKAEYSATRKSIERTNRLNEGVYAQSGIRSGAARYAPEHQADVIADVQMEGIRRLQDLDTKYNAAVSAANAALKAKNYVLAKQKADEAVKIQQDFLDESRDRASEARKLNDETRKQTRQATRDSAVAGLISQGITDKKEMLDYLNYSQDGTQIGDFTAKEIDDTVKALTGDATEGKYDKLSGDTRDFYLLKGIPNGLPANILALPEDQQLFAYIRAKGEAGRKGETGDKPKTYTFSNEARGKLIGTGLSNDAVDYIEKGINEFGAEEVLASQTDLSEDQKDVLRNLITGKERTFINNEFITGAYDDTILRQAANAAGYSSGGGFFADDQGVGDDALNEFLADLMGTVDTYREMGLTDKEIQKKLDEKIQELADEY